jgi:hypothetical protein
MNIRDGFPEPFYMVIVRYLKGHTNYIGAMATNLKPLRKYKGYTDVVYDKINNIIYGIIYIMFYDAYRIGYGYISLLSWGLSITPGSSLANLSVQPSLLDTEPWERVVCMLRNCMGVMLVLGVLW